MKSSYAPPRQLAKKPIRLDLRRATPYSPEDEVMVQRKSTFWKWFGFVALLHVIAICLFGIFYAVSPTPKPPEQFISLLPDGDVVKGTPGAQKAPKVGQATPAPSIPKVVTPPTPTPPIPQPVQPPPPTAVIPPPPAPTPKPIQPKPVVIKPDAPLVSQDKPVTPPKPKVKVDLTKLVDGPTTDAPKVAKHKPQVKKPVAQTTANDTPNQNAAPESESHGLSKEQIAHELGQKFEDAGVKDAVKLGSSGAANSQPNSFADFYASIRDQVMNKWQHPNQVDDSAVNPIVQIHVEKDGRVPPESVTLTRSSGNQAYDDSALTAAKSLGYLLQPLPDGCPPDIPITFKLTR